MDLRTAARVHAAGRVAVGSAFALLPARAGAGWIGSAAEDPLTAVLTRALGARDAALGAGVLCTIADGDHARSWILACVVADAVDCLASLAERDRLPPGRATGVPLLAAASTLFGAWLAAALD